ncbi:hypothetical protein B0T21DRAFT_411049 [Apiosordaria backusii]|uniref:Uncharacterized protein n=1 Tax=Apiosordaria backusii TaxID=314023 RepID=A0AA40BNP6_9PEZI|nr:hypothetical protein B0T21DRAFT_411049 [Apiosordaria backusii]
MDPTFHPYPSMSGANPEADQTQRTKSRKSSKSSTSVKSSKKQQSSPTKERGDERRSGGGVKLLTKVSKLTGWLSTSEPSTQALLSHQKETFRKAGVPLTDSEAHSKLRAPIGEIPSDAITSTTGPDPEELLRRKKEERKRRERERRGSEATTMAGSVRSGGSGSGSLSGYSMSGGSSVRKGSLSSPVGGGHGGEMGQVPWNYGWDDKWQ